jgi:hypothetical protein
MAAGTMLIVAPYLAFNRIVFGHFTPIAGAVKQFDTARILTARFGEGWSLDLAEYVVTAFASTAARLALLVAEAYAALGLMGVYIAAFSWRDAPMPWVFLKMLWFGAVVAGSLLIVKALWRPRHDRVPGSGWDRAVDLRGCGMLGVYVIADLAFSAVVYPIWMSTSGYWWWFANVLVFGVIVTACAAAIMARRVGVAVSSAALAGVLVLALANAALWTGYRIFETTVRGVPRTHLMATYENALWMNANFPNDAVVAAGNAGVAGFFFRGHVVDLAGVANSFEFLDHLRQRRVGEYVAATGITHVLERGPINEWVVPIRRVLRETDYRLPSGIGVVGVYELDHHALTRRDR